MGAVFMKQGRWRTRIASGAGVCVSVNVEVGPVRDTTRRISRNDSCTDEFERKECDCLWQILGAA